MKEFLNTSEEENNIWNEEEFLQYYHDLQKNKEWSACHMTFEAWLFDQEQFEKI